MEGLLSQIQSLDASDIASILKQVQSGSLSLEETAPEANNIPQGLPQRDDTPSITQTVDNFVDSVAESENDTNADPLTNLTTRHISLKRPGRSALLQSTELDVIVPQSRTELQKQIFQARMMGAPTDIANRLSQKAGLGSPPRVKPNIGMCRSVSRNAPQESNKRDADRLNQDHIAKSPERSLYDSGSDSRHTTPPKLSPDRGARASPSSSRSRDDRTERKRYGETRSDHRRHPDIDKENTDRRRYEERQPKSERSDRTRNKSGDRSRSPVNKPRNSDQKPDDQSQASSKHSRSSSCDSSSEKKISTSTSSSSRYHEEGRKSSPEWTHKHGRSDHRRSSDNRSASPGSQLRYSDTRNSDRTSKSLNCRPSDKGGRSKSDQISGSENPRSKYDRRVHADSDHNDSDNHNEDPMVERKRRRVSPQRRRSKASKRRADHEGDSGYKMRRISRDKSKDSASHSDAELSTSIEEIQEIAPVTEEPLPDVVLSQVDKEAATCSLESLGQFKIPKKAPAPKPEPSEDKKQTLPAQESRKRGAAHEKVDVVAPVWHGVSQISGSGGRTLATVRAIVNNETPTCKTKAEQILETDWFENITSVRTILPEIPSLYTYLSKEEVQEIQQEYQAPLKKKKKKKSPAAMGFKQAKTMIESKKSDFVCSLGPIDDWIENQKKLFKQLLIGKYIRAINHTDIDCFKYNPFCYLCRRSCSSVEKYNDHVNGRPHAENIARAHTAVGKMFFIKYMKSVANKEADITEDMEEKRCSHLTKSANFCELCKKPFEGSRKKHKKSKEHKERAVGGVRPKCEVCDIVFNSLKDQRHHMTRHYHKTNVQRKIEYGELPSDYEDPVLAGESSQEEDDRQEDGKSSVTMEISPVETPAVSDDEALEEPMEIDDLSSDDDQNYQHPKTKIKLEMLFETSQDEIEKGKKIRQERIHEIEGKRTIKKEKRETKEDVLYSHKNYGEWQYFQDFQNLYPGIQVDIWRHLSRQAWIDVVEEYRIKLKELKEDPVEDAKNAKDYVRRQIKQKTYEEVMEEIYSKSSGESQMAVLDWLGVKQYIEGKVLTKWFCYVCMEPNVCRRTYVIHMRGKKHLESLTNARTTIGRMLLIKCWQSQPATAHESPATAHESPTFKSGENESESNHKDDAAIREQYCVVCDDTYQDTQMSHKRSMQHQIILTNKSFLSGDFVRECTICEGRYREKREKRHLKTLTHSVNLACKIDYNLLPLDYEDDLEWEERQQCRGNEFPDDEDTTSDAELIALGKQLMIEVQGIFCKVCGLFSRIYSSTGFEAVAQEHIKEEGHQLKLQEKMKEKKKNSTRHDEDAQASTSEKMNKSHDELPSSNLSFEGNTGHSTNVKLSKCSVTLSKLSISDIHKYIEMDANIPTANRGERSTQEIQPGKFESESAHDKTIKLEHDGQLQMDGKAGAVERTEREASRIEDGDNVKIICKADTKKELPCASKPKKSVAEEGMESGKKDVKVLNTKRDMKDGSEREWVILSAIDSSEHIDNSNSISDKEEQLAPKNKLELSKKDVKVMDTKKDLIDGSEVEWVILSATGSTERIDNSKSISEKEEKITPESKPESSTVKETQSLEKKASCKTDTERKSPHDNESKLSMIDNNGASSMVHEDLGLNIPTDGQCARTRVYSRIPKELACEMLAMDDL